MRVTEGSDRGAAVEPYAGSVSPGCPLRICSGVGCGEPPSHVASSRALLLPGAFFPASGYACALCSQTWLIVSGAAAVGGTVRVTATRVTSTHHLCQPAPEVMARLALLLIFLLALFFFYRSSFSMLTFQLRQCSLTLPGVTTCLKDLVLYH